MAHDTTHLAEVHAAYLDARGHAQGASTRWLTRHARRWERQRDTLDQATLARLKAVRYELADRGIR